MTPAPIPPHPHTTHPHIAHPPPRPDHLTRLIATSIIGVASGAGGGLLLFITGWFYAALAAHHTSTPDNHGTQILALAALFGAVGALTTGLTGAAITWRTTTRRSPQTPKQHNT